MSSMNEKYNLVINKIENINKFPVEAIHFELNNKEFEEIIKQLEYDGLIEQGDWVLPKGYIFRGLTFQGRNFIEHNDSKEYHKIEKTEIYNNLNIGENHGTAVVGNNNIINNSEFNQKFTQLINEIKNSNIGDKSKIIQDLNENKENKDTLQKLLGTLLTRGTEVATIVSSVGVLLGVLG
jgi:hypothetical protein